MTASRWKTVGDLAGDNAWEEEYYTFRIVGSKLDWEAASYSRSMNRVRISRVIVSGGKPFLMGLRYEVRYVSPDALITQLTLRNK